MCLAQLIDIIVIRATFFFNLQRNNVEKRCCTYYHKPQTLPRNKILLLQVENLLRHALQLATTKLCCVAIFEVGCNMCNNAFQLLQQFVAHITSLLLHYSLFPSLLTETLF